MGTWSISPEKIPELILDLEQFKEKAYTVAGDDSLFDCIDRGINRLKHLRHIQRKESLSLLIADGTA
jgi:hypothetical protein